MKNRLRRIAVVTLLTGVHVGLSAQAATCELSVTHAWIREAPPTVSALAGYAQLANNGSKPLTVTALQSAAFASVQMHETLTENGISKMRALSPLQLAAGAKVEFAPGGKHFMLMQPKAALRAGDVVSVKLTDSNGCDTVVSFKVTRNGPADATDHSSMDHSSMDHAKMNHANMDGGSMDHEHMHHDH